MLGATPEVARGATPYLSWVLGSSGLLALSLVYDSALRANKNMSAPMWIALVVTAVKLLANWFLIFGNAGAPRLGLTGAGIASALSQVIGLMLFLVVVAQSAADTPVAIRWRHLRAAGSLRRDVVRIALPGVGERVIMNVAMLSFFWVLSHYYGTLSVAAYTVGVAMLSFSWIPGIAYATSCATLVGQALGAGDVEAATQAGWRSVRLAMATAVIMGIMVAAIRYPLARIFTDDQAVIEALIPFMLALALIQPFLQAHFCLGGAHRGAGDTWTPLVAAAVGNWVFRVPLAWLFAAVLETSVLWIWFSLNLDHVARTAYLAWSFHRGDWAKKLVD
jgi:putative MATE family efflux protein